MPQSLPRQQNAVPGSDSRPLPQLPAKPAHFETSGQWKPDKSKRSVDGLTDEMSTELWNYGLQQNTHKEPDIYSSILPISREKYKALAKLDTTNNNVFLIYFWKLFML